MYILASSLNNNLLKSEATKSHHTREGILLSITKVNLTSFYFVKHQVYQKSFI